MRVLLVSLAVPSHYFPIVPVAWALRAAGHEVRVAGQPSMTEAIERSGMTPVVIGRDTTVMRRADDPHWAERASVEAEARQVAGRNLQPHELSALPPELRRKVDDLRYSPIAEMMNSTADDLVEFALGWRPDLIITDPYVYAVPLAAAVIGVPVVRYLWGPDFQRHLGFFPGVGSEWPGLLLEIFDRFGVEAPRDFAARTIDPCPGSAQVAGVPNRVAYQFVPYNGPGTAPGWLLKPRVRPRICLTWGTGTTHVMGSSGFLVPTVIEALADLDVDVVVAVRKQDRELLKGPPPERVTVVEQLPLSAVLPTCGVIVHQGGGGSTLTSAVYGIPQVILPQVMDQHFNAERLARTGAAVSVASTRPDSGESSVDIEAVRAAVQAALFTDGPRAAARKLRNEMLAAPPPTQIASILEELI